MTCKFCKEEDGRDPKIGLICGVCYSCASERPKVFDACLSGTFDFDQYIADGGKQAGTMIQTLILSKERFGDRESAVTWIENNDFSAEKVDETENSFRFRQRDPSDFDPNGFGPGEQFRTITITTGVSAVVGFLIADKADHTRPLNADGTCPSGFRRQGNICVRSGRMSKFIEKRRSYAFTKVDDEKRIVTGPVLVPNVTDLQGDFEFAEDIEKTAHRYLEHARRIGEQHQIFDGIGVPVESHITRSVIKSGNGKTLPVGTWIMSIKVTNNSTWAKVKDGRITGFSIGFRGIRSEVR